MAADLDLPEPRGRTLAGVPESPLLEDPRFRKVFEETQARRGSLGLIAWAAQDAPDVLEALERFSERYPELAADPVSRWLPSDYILAEMRRRMLAGMEPDKVAKQPPADGRRTHWTRQWPNTRGGPGIRR